MKLYNEDNSDEESEYGDDEDDSSDDEDYHPDQGNQEVQLGRLIPSHILTLLRVHEVDFGSNLPI